MTNYDSLGNAKIYADSATNIQNVFINTPRENSHFKMGGYLGGMHAMEDGIAFTLGNNRGALKIFTTSGYSSGKVNRNHGECSANGFMQDTRDFRNIEVTLYLKLIDSTSNSHITVSARGGDLNGVQNCEGSGVRVNLGYDGKVRASKLRRYLDSLSYGEWKEAIGDIEGRWIGLKVVFYNVPQGVKYEVYLDTTQSNVWTKYYETVDDGTGALGGPGIYCSGRTGQPVTWGGPIVHITWDNVTNPDGIIFKRISVREITPPVYPTDSTGGGTIITGTTVITTTPPVNYTAGGSYVPGATYNPSTGTYTGGGSGSTGGGLGSGDGTGGTGTGINTPYPAETQILYERKEFTMRWNINFVSGDACGVGKSPENLPLVPIYDVTGDVYVEGKDYPRCGLFINRYDPFNRVNSSLFVNKNIRALTLVIKKAGTVTGNITIVIRDSTYAIMATLGTIDSTLLTTSDQTFLVSFPTNAYRFQVGDYLSVEYPSNTSSNYIRVKVSQVDKSDGVNTILYIWDGVTRYIDPNADFAALISI